MRHTRLSPEPSIPRLPPISSLGKTQASGVIGLLSGKHLPCRLVQYHDFGGCSQETPRPEDRHTTPAFREGTSFRHGLACRSQHLDAHPPEAAFPGCRRAWIKISTEAGAGESSVESRRGLSAGSSPLILIVS